MHRNPERLAWTVLVVSLLMCIGLTIAVPVSVSHFINNTAEVASITLETWAGVPLVYLPGQTAPTGVTVQTGQLTRRFDDQHRPKYPGITHDSFPA